MTKMTMVIKQDNSLVVLCFVIALALLLAALVRPAEGDNFQTKSTYKTKARWFRRIEQQQLDLVRHYFIVQSWREIEDPSYRSQMHPGLFPAGTTPNTSVYPVLPSRLSDRYYGDNLDRLIRSRRGSIR